MTSLAIGMQTAWRPKEVISDSLTSLRSAGFNQPVHVFGEPNAYMPRTEGVIPHVNREILGCFPNWKNSVLWLLEYTTADWILMLQDDVIWRNDGGLQLAAGMRDFPAVGLLSPYTSPKMVPHEMRLETPADDRWQEAQFYDKAFIGALALCFPRRSLELLVSHERFLGHTHHRKTDVLVGNTLRLELGLSILVHVPSLADHTGSWSTIGRHRIRGIQWGRKGLGYRETA